MECIPQSQQCTQPLLGLQMIHRQAEARQPRPQARGGMPFPVDAQIEYSALTSTRG